MSLPEIATTNNSTMYSTIIRLAILFVLIGITLIFMNKKAQSAQEKRSTMLAKKYKVMTKELLDSTPDEDLLDAVAANLMEKVNKQSPDPLHEFALLSPGRFQLYSVWLIMNELKNGGSFNSLLAGPSAVFSETAADGFDRIEAHACANAVRDALQVGDEWEKLSDCNEAYANAVAEENPKNLCIDYIRNCYTEFIDESTEEPNE